MQPTPEHLDTDPLDLADIAAVRAGQSGAWSRLLERYQDRLFGVCIRMVVGGASGGAAHARARQTAADLCQDAMVKIIQGLPSFDGSAKFSTWAIRVTMNVCLSHLRASKVRKHLSLDDLPPGVAHSTSPSRPGASLGESPGSRPRHIGTVPPSASSEPVGVSGVLHHEQKQAVLAALDRLDAEQRAIVVLRDVRGLDYDQIAQVLGVAVGTVKSRLFRARAALREAIESQQPGGGGLGPADD